MFRNLSPQSYIMNFHQKSYPATRADFWGEFPENGPDGWI